MQLLAHFLLYLLWVPVLITNVDFIVPLPLPLLYPSALPIILISMIAKFNSLIQLVTLSGTCLANGSILVVIMLYMHVCIFIVLNFIEHFNVGLVLFIMCNLAIIFQFLFLLYNIFIVVF